MRVLRDDILQLKEEIWGLFSFQIKCHKIKRNGYEHCVFFWIMLQVKTAFQYVLLMFR